MNRLRSFAYLTYQWRNMKLFSISSFIQCKWHSKQKIDTMMVIKCQYMIKRKALGKNSKSSQRFCAVVSENIPWIRASCLVNESFQILPVFIIAWGNTRLILQDIFPLSLFSSLFDSLSSALIVFVMISFSIDFFAWWQMTILEGRFCR